MPNAAQAEKFDPQRHDAQIGEVFRELNRIHGEITVPLPGPTLMNGHPTSLSEEGLNTGIRTAAERHLRVDPKLGVELLNCAADFAIEKQCYLEALLAAGALLRYGANVDHAVEYGNAILNSVAAYLNNAEENFGKHKVEAVKAVVGKLQREPPGTLD